MRDDNRSAGVSPAVSGASRPRFGEVTIRDRGRLPHWEIERGMYFVTFRLADSLPAAVLQQITHSRKLIEQAEAAGLELLAVEKKRLARVNTSRIERYLDSGSGECLLRRPECARIVVEALKRFDNSRYRLHAWCVMPNHVHVVVRLSADDSLAKVIHTWKSYTAHAINRFLERSGEVWQREYYDHLIRSGEEFDRARAYVVANPLKAGVAEWPWVWAGETPA